MIKQNLEKLKEDDLYSLALFSLYKMTQVPEYSSISELAYVLDKDNLLNLCEYFGGQTLRIPTIDELENLLYAILIAQRVKVEGMSYDEALEKSGKKDKDIKKYYLGLQEVLNNYDFKPREKY